SRSRRPMATRLSPAPASRNGTRSSLSCSSTGRRARRPTRTGSGHASNAKPNWASKPSVKGSLMIMKSRHTAGTVTAVRVATGFAVPLGQAFGSEVNTGYFGGVAIEGYDTVAYFTDNRPVKGSPDISYQWRGATWHFSSDEHRKLFVANPE